VAVKLAVLIKALERRRIRMALVERAHFLGGNARRHRGIFSRHAVLALPARRVVPRPLRGGGPMHQHLSISCMGRGATPSTRGEVSVHLTPPPWAASSARAFSRILSSTFETPQCSGVCLGGNSTMV